jgi:hypothetical protein
MLTFEIKPCDTTREGAEKREYLGVVRGAGRGDHPDDEQNDGNDKQAEAGSDGGLQMQTRLSTSPYPWQEPHGSPFVDTIFFFANGIVLSLAFSAHESQLSPFSPFEQVPVPSQWRHSMAMVPPLPADRGAE